jgi:uncharacterized phage protein (TIGR01671 family)
MKKIKFRMWSEKANKYFYGPQVFECLMQQYCHDNGVGGVAYDHVGDGMAFEQFTGLKDKYGVEIFEGDIIVKRMLSRQFSSKKKSCKAWSVVIWMEGFKGVQDNDHNNRALSKDPSIFNMEPGFTAREIFNEKGYHCQSWSDFSGCEVVGNIHQNQELLIHRTPENT